MDGHEKIASELDEEREGLRDSARANGWDPSCERARDWNTAVISGERINRVWSAMYAAARSIRQLIEANTKLQRRNEQLASSNGALMADRTRGIDEATERAQAAVLWAAEVARVAGIPEEEWPEQARARLRDERAAQVRLERDNQRLEELRTTMVVPLIRLCDEAASVGGFTVDQLRQLHKKLDAANKKAMGR